MPCGRDGGWGVPCSVIAGSSGSVRTASSQVARCCLGLRLRTPRSTSRPPHRPSRRPILAAGPRPVETADGPKGNSRISRNESEPGGVPRSRTQKGARNVEDRSRRRRRNCGCSCGTVASAQVAPPPVPALGVQKVRQLDPTQLVVDGTIDCRISWDFSVSAKVTELGAQDAVKNSTAAAGPCTVNGPQVWSVTIVGGQAAHSSRSSRLMARSPIQRPSSRPRTSTSAASSSSASDRVVRSASARECCRCSWRAVIETCRLVTTSITRSTNGPWISRASGPPGQN